MNIVVLQFFYTGTVTFRQNKLLTDWLYAGFSKGGAGNLKIMKTKRKMSPFRISPLSCPKLGEDQKKKKGLHSKLVWFWPKITQRPKKKVFTQILPFCVLKFSAQVTKGGAMPQFCILFYFNYIILATQRGGAMAPWPTLNVPVAEAHRKKPPERWLLKISNAKKLFSHRIKIKMKQAKRLNIKTLACKV